MPFGLMGPPSLFQWLMNVVLSEYIQFSSACIDDVVVYSQTFKDHIHHVDLVLSQLKKYGLMVKPSKCQLAMRECKYLGHWVGGGCVRLIEAKVEALRNYSRPRKKKDVQAFLGLANYYRKFIPGFTMIALPLTKATRKNKPDVVEWTKDRIEAFKKLKNVLTSESVLASSDTTRPFILQTDVSVVGIGAVLSQVDDTEVKRPVAYYSRKLDPRETRYTVTEQECLAVVQ